MKYSYKDIIAGRVRDSGLISEHDVQKSIQESITTTDEDIDEMVQMVKLLDLVRKPKYYLVLFIFFRYRIPILYYRVINFIKIMFI